MELTFQDLSNLPDSFQALDALIGTHACDLLKSEQNRLVFVLLNKNTAQVYQSENTKNIFKFNLNDVKNLTHSVISIHLSNAELKITPLIVVCSLTASALKLTLAKKSHGELLLINPTPNTCIHTHQIVLEDEAVLQNAWMNLQIADSFVENISLERVVEINQNACFYDQQIFASGFPLSSSAIKTKVFSKIKLLGESAQSISSGCLLSNSGEFYYEPVQEHFAKRGKSSLNFKIVLDKRAKSFFRGLVILQKDAQQSQAYQENKNLLLSRNARADSEPRLEIIPNDVMCKHGSATAELDTKQLYYIMSRGFDKQQGKTMIIKSFCKAAFLENEKENNLFQAIVPFIIDHVFTTYFKIATT